MILRVWSKIKNNFVVLGMVVFLLLLPFSLVLEVNVFALYILFVIPLGVGFVIGSVGGKIVDLYFFFLGYGGIIMAGLVVAILIAMPSAIFLTPVYGVAEKNFLTQFTGLLTFIIGFVFAVFLFPLGLCLIGLLPYFFGKFDKLLAENEING